MELETLVEPQMLLTCFATTAACLLAWIVYNRWRYRLPAGPWAWPIVGNLRDFSREPRAHVMYGNLQKKYGDIFLVYFGSKPCVVLNSAKLVKEALVKNPNAFSGRPIFTSGNILTDGGQDISLGQPTDIWKMQKKIASIALSSYMSSGSHNTCIQKSCSVVCGLLRENPKKEPFHPYTVATLLVYGALCNMVDDKKYNTDDAEFQRFVESHQQAAVAFSFGLPSDHYPFRRFFGDGKNKRFLKERVDVFLGILADIYTKHRESYYKKDKLNDVTYQMLNALEQVKQEEGEQNVAALTDDHFIQILSDLFFAGADTMIHTMVWFMLYMAEYPKVQKKVQKEIDSAVDESKDVSTGDVKSLVYTQAVLHEVMRLRPVMPLALPHQTTTHCKLGGYDIPAGTMCHVNLWAVHRNPAHWQDPDVFRPERFLDASGRLTTKPDHFLPFSAGPRSCLGETMAKLQIVTMAAILLREFSLSPSKSNEIPFDSDDIKMSTIPPPVPVMAKPRTEFKREP